MRFDAVICDILDYLAPMHGLLLVYRRYVTVADVSSLVRCDPMWSDAVISHTVQRSGSSRRVRMCV